MIIDEEVYVEHFGVKGQKWGVRKERISDKDVSLKRETEFLIYQEILQEQRQVKYTQHIQSEMFLIIELSMLPI